jgi:F-type H+-transporting ATPase subunit delta
MASNESRNKPIATRYAAALLQLANRSGQANAVRDELKGLAEVLNASPTFAAVIADPGVSIAKRQSLLQRTFNGRVSPVLMNFLGLLNSKGRLTVLPQIINVYQDLLADEQGIVEVDITVSQRLTPEQLETARERVSAALKRTAVIHQYVDESIIGGLVLRVQDKLIDASVKFQLEQMRRQMLAASPR